MWALVQLLDMEPIFQTKVFTTGEGGCIVTDSKDIYEKLKLIRSHGRAG
ncbi:unnamed protein product, partial [marine sediment metagenome]